MKCMLSLMATKPKECLTTDCVLWETDRNKCLLASYLQSYIKQQLVSLQLLRMGDRINEKLDKDEKEF